MLDARQRRAAAADDAPGRGLDAELVGQRRRHRLRLDPRRRASRLGGAGAPAAPSARWRRRRGASTPRRGGLAARSCCTRSRAGRAGSSWAARRSPAPRTPFRSARAGVSATEFFYTADGKIRQRAVGARCLHRRAVHGHAAGDAGALHARRARLRLTHATQGARHGAAGDLARRHSKVAFAAVGDIWVMPVGGAAENITKDRFLDTDPAWSPDGAKLVYSSDKGGALLQLWIRDLATGQDRQLTKLTTQPQGATWSPDGTRIAFFDVDGMWRRAPVSVVDVATGEVTRIHDVAVLAGHADLVARRRAGGGGDGVVLLDALPRRHQPGADDVVDRRRRHAGSRRIRTCRSTRAAAAARSGRPTAPRWRRSTKACWRCGRSRATGEPLGPPRRVTLRDGALAELGRRLEAAALPVDGQAADRRHRDRPDRAKCRCRSPTPRPSRPGGRPST